MSKYSKRLRKFLPSAFIYSNDEIFDEDFRQLLQIFYIYGFHQQVPSTERSYRGSVVLLFGVTYFLGFVKDLSVSLSESNLQRIMTNVPYTAIVFNFVTQAITFLVKQREIVEMVKGFQSMHEPKNDPYLNYYRTKCCQLLKYYIAYLKLTGVVVLCFNVCGYKMFKLLVPALYDDFADGNLFYPLLILNTVHVCGLLPLIVSCDLLDIVCIVRAGANLQLLSDNLRQCTESSDLKKNERMLIKCIEYHHRILK